MIRVCIANEMAQDACLPCKTKEINGHFDGETKINLRAGIIRDWRLLQHKRTGMSVLVDLFSELISINGTMNIRSFSLATLLIGVSALAAPNASPAHGNNSSHQMQHSQQRQVHQARHDTGTTRVFTGKLANTATLLSELDTTFGTRICLNPG